ncbi:hypothetical protein M8C21_019813 [Ambrosia artemisiifolia]|uniref:Uncharacterized protein n=1 Tax=Ambrosia artemisiifolia TaxID=4212 RepID=A0AAD5GHZ1_AMBAR|nr:hypothetical protein M8C21_019813 [Ambrosia artemisiifolia]
MHLSFRTRNHTAVMTLHYLVSQFILQPWHGFDQACLCRCRPRDQKVVMMLCYLGWQLMLQSWRRVSMIIFTSSGRFVCLKVKEKDNAWFVKLFQMSGGVTGTIADHIISASFFYEDKTSLLQTAASTSNFICGFEDEGLTSVMPVEAQPLFDLP